MVISMNSTKLEHAAKGQKHAVPPELFFDVLNFNNLSFFGFPVVRYKWIQPFGWQKVDVIAYC